MDWKFKLARVQELAREKHSELKKRTHSPAAGGCLLTGAQYGTSNTLFLGLNPGRIVGDNSFGVDLNSASPVSEWSDLAFWKNLGVFLKQASGLRHWFDHQVTSAFVCPWRTDDVHALRKLNQDLDYALFNASGDILAQMI